MNSHKSELYPPKPSKGREGLILNSFPISLSDLRGLLGEVGGRTGQLTVPGSFQGWSEGSAGWNGGWASACPDSHPPGAHRTGYLSAISAVILLPQHKDLPPTY